MFKCANPRDSSKRAIGLDTLEVDRKKKKLQASSSVPAANESESPQASSGVPALAADDSESRSESESPQASLSSGVPAADESLRVHATSSVPAVDESPRASSGVPAADESRSLEVPEDPGPGSSSPALLAGDSEKLVDDQLLGQLLNSEEITTDLHGDHQDDVRDMHSSCSSDCGNHSDDESVRDTDSELESGRRQPPQENDEEFRNFNELHLMVTGKHDYATKVLGKCDKDSVFYSGVMNSNTNAFISVGFSQVIEDSRCTFLGAACTDDPFMEGPLFVYASELKKTDEDWSLERIILQNKFPALGDVGPEELPNVFRDNLGYVSTSNQFNFFAS